MRMTGAGVAILLAVSASPLAGAPARMAGFAALAGDRIDIAGIPAWRSGDFRIGTDGTRGHIRRRAVGTTEVSDPDGHRRVEHVTRRGTLSFVATGPSVGGTLAGECGYDRQEARLRDGAVETSVPTLPLRYGCTFTQDGRASGELTLEARPGQVGLVTPAIRTGRIVFAGTALDLRSVHRLEGIAWPVEQPAGYLIAAAGASVAAVDLNDGRRAALVLPRDPASRRAALAAGLALALFWDPGDTDE